MSFAVSAAQSDYALVVLERSRQVADLQIHRTELGGIGQSEGGRRHGVRARLGVHDSLSDLAGVDTHECAGPDFVTQPGRP